MTFQIRTVPGQTEEGVRGDVERLLAGIKTDFPAFDARVMIPADGPEAAGMDPMYIEKDDPLVTGPRRRAPACIRQPIPSGGRTAAGQCRRREPSGRGGHSVAAVWPG